MPIATIRSPVVTVMLRSNTGGMVGADISGMVKTGSVSGMLSRKMTMLKNANGSSSRGNEIRYMAVAFFARGVAGTKSSSGTRVGEGASIRDCSARAGRAEASNGWCKHESADGIAVRRSPKQRGHEAVRACAHGRSPEDQEGAQASFFDLSTWRPRYMPVLRST